MSNHAVITTAFTNTPAQLLGNEQTSNLSAPGYPGFTSTGSPMRGGASQRGPGTDEPQSRWLVRSDRA